MGGAGFVQKVGIVRRVLVFVLDDGRQGEPAGRDVAVAFFGDTGEEFGTVRLVAGGRQFAGTGTAAVQKGLERFQIDGFARREPVDGDADGLAVGLAEDRDLQCVAKLR